MSLQVWLPLTKDLRQQGLSNATVTNNGATFNENGKLGGCYSFPTTGNGSNLSIPSNTMSSFTASNGCSLAFWIKLNTWYSSYATFFQAGTGSNPWSHYIFGILRNGTDSTVCFTIGNGSTASNSSYLTSAWEKGVWFHMVFTYETGKCKIYKNGVLDKEYNTSIVPDFSKITKITIGRCNNDTSYQTDCEMNDFRIYDHCLSPMEIKQLSQGLVLHYPLNRNGFGQENLIANTDFDGVSKKYTVTSSTEGGFKYTPTETIVANTEYTISCRLRGDANMNLYKICTGGNEAIYFVNRDQLSTSEYRRFSITFTYPSNKTLDQIYICTRYGAANSQAGDWFEIEPCSLKLEKGSIATPWCPNSSDTLAMTMGLNSTIEYDCSGFCNNGTRTGTFTWTSDTPKYQVSTKFTGTQFITADSPTSEGATLVLWAKTTSTSNAALVVDYKSKLGFGFWSGVIIPSCNSNIKTTYLTTNYIINQWNHIAVVRNSSSTLQLYINGVLQTNIASTQDYWSGGVIDGLSIAARPNGSSPTSCQINDFRIYATALSADDVKSLYQNCATIDPDGTIRGQIRS